MSTKFFDTVKDNTQASLLQELKGEDKVYVQLSMANSTLNLGLVMKPKRIGGEHWKG